VTSEGILSVAGVRKLRLIEYLHDLLAIWET